MTPRLSALSLITSTIVLAGLGLNSPKANAQNFPLETTYSTQVNLTDLGNNIFRADLEGTSNDAPYGLTNFSITNSYAKFNPATNEFVFDPNPEVFNLENEPKGQLTLSGDSSDKLFGELAGSTIIDFSNSVGSGSSTLKIVGGEGRFVGATGVLDVLENDIVTSEGAIQPSFTTSGSFQISQTVPEPRNTKTILGIGIIGSGLLVGQRRKKSNRNLTKANL